MTGTTPEVPGRNGQLHASDSFSDAALTRGSHDKAELVTQVSGIVEVILRESARLAEEVDRLRRGDSQGTGKHEHIAEMAREAFERADRAGFQGVEFVCAVLGSTAHDIGKIEYQLQSLTGILPDGLKDRQFAQGPLGIDVLEQIGVFQNLTPSESFLLKFIVFYHGSRSIPGIGEIVLQVKEAFPNTTSQEQAELALSADRLCYFVRDHDKISIFREGPRYREPEFILQELEKWYFSADRQRLVGGEEIFDREITKTPAFRDAALSALMFLLDSKPGEKPESYHASQDPSEKATFDKLATLMDEGINPKVMADFMAGRTANKADIGTSWSSYMLYAVAFIHDMRDPSALREVCEIQMLDDWVKFLQTKLSDDEYSGIKARIDQVFETRIEKRYFK